MIAKTLAQLTLNITDGKHGDCHDQTNSGYYFISCKDVKNGHIDYEGARQITEHDFIEANNRTRLEPDDILVTNSGTIGRMAYITDAPETARTTFQKSVAIVKPNPEIVLPRYLYYQLQNCVDQFVNQSNGSAQKNLLLSTMRSFKMFIHEDTHMQHRIAAILSEYDNLIENNQKQIKLLEEAARRLYREWFVDLRFPGHKHVQIVDGVPEGWKNGILHDVSKEVGKKVNEPDILKFKYYLPIDCLPKQSIGYTEVCDIHLASSSLISFQKDDILFGAMRPYFHKVVVARDSGLTRTTCFVVNSRRKEYWAFLVMTMFSEDTVRFATQISVGTTMPYVRWSDFQKMQLLIPAENIAESFNQLAVPLIEKIEALCEQNMKLSEARGRLLPRLMSGEIEL